MSRLPFFLPEADPLWGPFFKPAFIFSSLLLETFKPTNDYFKWNPDLHAIYCCSV